MAWCMLKLRHQSLKFIYIVYEVMRKMQMTLMWESCLQKFHIQTQKPDDISEISHI